jgi:hypothetical protein
MVEEPSHIKQPSLNPMCKIGLKNKGKIHMVEEPSHIKQLSLNLVCKIGFKGKGKPLWLRSHHT